MPFYNHATFVEEAVDSVRSQTHPVHEIVLVDDGSTQSRSGEILASLAKSGVTVIHQPNQGPGTARNTGVAHSSGEAVLFLDSDDMLSNQQVETAMAALVTAPSDVGFVYPDLQFFGNQERLLIMPPYNLYLLMFRNFCAMGCLVDRGVFDAGFRFRDDRAQRHEDWDFFLSLGGAGIHGVPNHAAPLRYRQHGYSRSDSVEGASGDLQDDIARLHPTLFTGDALIEVKRQWSPALTIVLAGAGATTIADQTCGDFEIVDAPHDGGMPDARGRWVVVIDRSGSSVLLDPEFVERLVRLALGRPAGTVLGLVTVDTPGATWRRVARAASRGATAVLMGGESYAQRRASARGGVGGPAELVEEMTRTRRTPEWWACPVGPSGSGSGSGSAGGSLRSPVTGPGIPPDNDPKNIEAQFRWTEAAPLFMPLGGPRRVPRPPAGFQNGVEAITKKAWAGWAPQCTVRLDLVRRANGSTFLDVVDDRFPSPYREMEVRVSLGRAWTRPLIGTTCLAVRLDTVTHALNYRVMSPRTAAEDDQPIAYVYTTPLPDSIDLRRAFDKARHALAEQLPETIFPTIDVELGRAVIDRPWSTRIELLDLHGAAIGAGTKSGAGAATGTGDSGAGAWLPLYELAMDGHRFRYTLSPDDCMALPEIKRQVAVAVARVATPGTVEPTAGLFEAIRTDGGGTWYVNSGELAEAGDRFRDPRLLGDITTRPGLAVPLLRLFPEAPAPVPDGEPGQRLAVHWQALVAAGYRAEGAIGYARPPDPGIAPLYRWSNPRARVHCITLGERPFHDLSTWEFDGTLGMAWQPATTVPGNVDLWELTGAGALTYSTEPHLLEELGFRARRVVARVHSTPSDASVPLLRARAPGSVPSFVTVSTFEALSAGMTVDTVLGYIETVPIPGSLIAEPQEVPDGWVAMPTCDGWPTPGALLAREPFPGGVAVCTDPADPTRLVAGEAGEPGEPNTTTRLVGYASGPLVPYARPVFLLRPLGAGAAVQKAQGDPQPTRLVPETVSDSLAITRRAGTVVVDVRCYAWGRPGYLSGGVAPAEADLDEAPGTTSSNRRRRPPGGPFRAVRR